MAAYHVGKQRQRDKDLSAKKAWLPPTAGLRDWRAQMPAPDIALFESLAKNALERFGYPIEAAGQDIAGRAELCRRCWAPRQRPQPLPPRGGKIENEPLGDWENSTRVPDVGRPDVQPMLSNRGGVTKTGPKWT